jgi:hypothetical protein
MSRPLKKPIYVLSHNIQVIGEYAPTKINPYWRLRIRPHAFFEGIAVQSNGMLVRKSRAILSSKLGRALTAEEIAHHDNENKLDDSLENIIVETASNHNKHHKLGAKHKEESKKLIGQSLRKAYKDGKKASTLKHNQDGELNKMAKLTREIVIEIKASNEKNTALAKRYGVTSKSIRNIKNGVTWK